MHLVTVLVFQLAEAKPLSIRLPPLLLLSSAVWPVFTAWGLFQAPLSRGNAYLLPPQQTAIVIDHSNWISPRFLLRFHEPQLY